MTASSLSAPFPYVHINLDGSARELSPDEREYLTAEYAPGDGNRPYVKGSHGARTPYGFLSGYMHRSQLPSDIEVRRVNPRYDELVRKHRVSTLEEGMREAQAFGDTITRDEDGFVMIVPNPEVPPKERSEWHRRHILDGQLQRESWALHPEDTE